ncbi:MAG: molybdenum cofactor guanylyltransferase [Candidatus Binatia bacterium]
MSSAILLVGGLSTRMGQPKALLPFDGEALVVHLVRRLRTRFDDLVVVAAQGQDLPALDANVVRDEIAEHGPIVGLHAAKHDGCFLASCDMPFLNAALAEHLVGQLGESDAVVPIMDGRLQPLHAAYSRKIADRLRAPIANGELRMKDLIARLRAKVVDEDSLRAVDSSGLSFKNMNLPEDYDAALRLWPEKGDRPIFGTRK